MGTILLELLPYTLLLCLAVLLLLTFFNLRGLCESGLAFMPPTYLFIGSGQTTMIIERGLTAPRLLVLSLCTIRLLYGSGNDSVDCKTKFLYELLQRR
jgi:hypothetical protein